MHNGFEKYLFDLQETDIDSEVVAFFDLDRTLISGYSITVLMMELIRSGQMTFREFVTYSLGFLEYGLGRRDYNELLELVSLRMRGREDIELMEIGRRAFDRKLEGMIYQQARILVEAHRLLGHRLVMLTSATKYQAFPIADALSIPDVECTQLDTENGILTGKYLPCFGKGKLEAAWKYLEEHNGNQVRGRLLGKAYFYTDSEDDLALLELCGYPVAINPKPSLATEARKRGWPQIEFERIPYIAA